MQHIAFLIGAVAWVMGIVLAKGFWWTVLAVMVAPYGWYLVAEKAMRGVGWL